MKLHRILLLLIAGALWRLPCVPGQNLPSIDCKYFEYLRSDDEFIGKITLPNISGGGNIVVKAQFSQREPVTSKYHGGLSLYHDKFSTVENLKNGEPLLYRVNFPFKNVVPKLTKLNFNNVLLCSSSSYLAPSTTINYEHTLQIPETLTFRTRPVPREPPKELPNELPRELPREPSQPHTNPFLKGLKKQQQQTSQPNFVFNRQSETTSQNTNSCGRESTTPVIGQYVYGGQVLTRGQFPWLTAIYKKHPSSAGLTFLCGGSLISARTVVTAAHCFTHPSELTAKQVVVYLGRYNLDDYDERFELRGVQKLIPHPDYNAVTFPDADIALVQLLMAVSFTDFIQPICLWSEPTDINIIIGEKGVVAGWGADENGRAVSNLPKMVDGDIVSENTCLKSLEAFRMLTSPRTICAGNRDGTGPCMGDSGGGLMIKREGRWVLRGIVSAGQTVQQQCNLREYVIYCDLAKHIQWVQDNVLN